MATLTDNTAIDLSMFETAKNPGEQLEAVVAQGSTKGTGNAGILQNEPLGQFHRPDTPEIIYDPANVKLISRMVAELTPDAEYKKFLELKKNLMFKKYSEGLSKKEELSLQLTLWNIDRIEDAKYGRHLDALETIVKTHEMVAQSITQTVNRLNQSIAEQSGKVRK
jgi:hypothetical protein